MGVRQRCYWMRQADAIKRQETMRIAQGVGIGMADKESREKAVDELELELTAEDSRKARSEAIWGVMNVFGRRGGKGV